MTRSIEWGAYSQAFAFLGNSLLSPMNQTSDAGLDPEFWEFFPSFGEDAVAAACARCGEAASAISKRGVREERDPVELASTEFTRLFIGPPSPAAAPWESFYRSNSENPVGFGQATFEMRGLLRSAGLEVSNENNQYEDHIGLELLFLSELCRRRADEVTGSMEVEAVYSDAAILAFVNEHPYGWIGALRNAVREVSPQGYIDGILGVAEALLGSLSARLA